MDFPLEAMIVRTAGIDPKHDGQFFFHDVPKDLELFLRQLELKLIERPEKWIILRDSGTMPF